jgi:polyhydroxybutyrate depolymerase
LTRRLRSARVIGFMSARHSRGAVAPARWPLRQTLAIALTLALGACQMPPEPSAPATETQATPPRTIDSPVVSAPVRAPVEPPRAAPIIAPPPETTLPPGVPAASRFVALKSGDQQRRLTVNAARRTYLLHVPVNYDPTVAHPLLIVLHGRGGSGAGARGWGFSQRAAQKGWLVVYPEALPPTRSWPTRLGNTPSAGNDVAYIEALLGDVRLLAHIDDARLFAVGYSTGGSFAAHLAGELKAPGISAIVLLGANIATRSRDGVLATVTLPARPVPALFLHGRIDRAAPFKGGPSVLLDGLNALGTMDGAQLWARAAGCAETPRAARGAPVELERFENCREGAVIDVETWAGGHEWPRTLPIEGRRPVATVDHILEFLEHARGLTSIR